MGMLTQHVPAGECAGARAAARVVHSPEAVQGRAAVEDVCEPRPAQPSRFELVAGPDRIRRAPPVRSTICSPRSVPLAAASLPGGSLQGPACAPIPVPSWGLSQKGSGALVLSASVYS